jgi:hypothetical protein
MRTSSKIPSRTLKIPDIEYGHPESLKDEDRKWLKELRVAIWRPTTPDRFGFTHYFPNEKRPLLQEELDKLVLLVKGQVLPCVMRSGAYGDLSITVYDHSDQPDITPDSFFSLHEDHLNFKDKTFEGHDKRFAEMSKLTHTGRNRQICEFYKLDLPQKASYYEY